MAAHNLPQYDAVYERLRKEYLEVSDGCLIRHKSSPDLYFPFSLKRVAYTRKPDAV